jgi:hypothetical protein
MESERVVALWDLYDSVTGDCLERGRRIKQIASPAVGMPVKDVSGKPQATVSNFWLRGRQEQLPWYDVYV